MPYSLSIVAELLVGVLYCTVPSSQKLKSLPVFRRNSKLRSGITKQGNLPPPRYRCVTETDTAQTAALIPVRSQCQHLNYWNSSSCIVLDPAHSKRATSLKSLTNNCEKKNSMCFRAIWCRAPVLKHTKKTGTKEPRLRSVAKARDSGVFCTWCTV